MAQIVATNPALASQPTEVCRLAGIDPARKGTVCTWIKGLHVDPAEVQQARVEGAVEIQKAATDRLAKMAENLYTLAEQAIGKVGVAITDPGELKDGKNGEPHDRDGAAWVRSLVGVMAQALDKAQLLSGKPTERSEARSEVNERHEYDVTHRIEQYADVFRNVARRGVPAGGVPGHGPGEPLDPPRSDPEAS